MENTNQAESKGSLKAYIAIVIVVLAAVIAIIYLSNNAKDTNDQDNNQNSFTGETVNYTINASNFEYSVDEISASPGDIVKVTLNVEEGSHSFTIDEIAGARTNSLNAGESETIEFKIPEDATGSYTFYCNVANHQNMGLEGKLVIK